MRDVITRQLPQHVVSHSVDNGLTCVAGLATNTLLRLNAQDGVQDAFRGVDLQQKQEGRRVD